MVLSLVAGVVHNPFFSQLRTQEQLGYVAFSTHRIGASGRAMLSFVVQSESNPAYLMQRIDSFARGFRQRLVDYTDSEFRNLVESQISHRSEAPKSIHWEAGLLWSRISDGDYDFGRLADEIACLRMLRKEDLLAAWDRHANPDSAANYTRIDRLLWPAASRAPSPADLQAYTGDVIALLGCLESAGFRGATLAELAATVGAASLAGRVNHALEALACIYVAPGTDRDTAQVVDRLGANGTCIRAALEAALAARDRQRAVADAAGDDTRKTPDGKYIIVDMDEFKAAHPLHDPPVPATALEPRHPSQPAV
ncbi:metalloprotease [Coemansia helicoidea]|uniref:Metalloprotease n=1 Tax=Coemansia helicoidea TaxID=1286919 RepID=A0ACC1KTL5_9FUNG|nr:metalloprotease [Coemansia helicoidea]